MSYDQQLHNKGPGAAAAVLAVAFVLSTVAGPVSLSADGQASNPAADPAAIVGEWFHRASGGSIFTWAFADPDTGEATVEWTVSHSAVPGRPRCSVAATTGSRAPTGSFSCSFRGTVSQGLRNRAGGADVATR